MGRTTATRPMPSSLRPGAPQGTGVSASAGVAARAVLSLVALGAVLFAVPYGLARLAGWPLPRAVPHLDQVTGGLRSTYVPDQVIVKGLAAVCWLVWAQLVVSIVLEVIAMLRGRRPVHVPLAGGSQRVAALLVGGVALLATLPGLRAPRPAIAPLVVRPATMVTVDRRGSALLASPDGLSGRAVVVGADGVLRADVPQAAAPRLLPAYEVQRRDTLWDIAERHLADPLRWPEIADLNRGVIQDDGRALEDPNLIQPGWMLRLPADAVGLPDPVETLAVVAPLSTTPLSTTLMPTPTPTPLPAPTGAPVPVVPAGVPSADVRVVVVSTSDSGSGGNAGYAVRVIDDGAGPATLADGG